MVKFGFSLESSYALPLPEVMDLLADAGFSAVSLSWQRHGNLKEAVRLAQERNLIVQSLHGPLRGMPAMWSRDPEISQPIFLDLMQSATDCAELGIPILVVHPWNGVDYTFREKDLFFRYFDTLVDHAERLGICIAFENLEGPEYLAALMTRYACCQAVGFCWDSGHERCYSPGWDLLSRYGHRLVMTHLNDNLGVRDPDGKLCKYDDLHYLPYDGNLNWAAALSRLKTSRRQAVLNFEFKIRTRLEADLRYAHLPLAEFIALAGKRAGQIAKEYEE